MCHDIQQKDTQQNDNHHKNKCLNKCFAEYHKLAIALVWLSITMLSVILVSVMLSDILLSIMLSVILLGP